MRSVLKFLSFDVFITPHAAAWVWIIWNIMFAVVLTVPVLLRGSTDTAYYGQAAMYCLANFIGSRIALECIVVVFKIHERLTELRDQQTGRPPAATGPRQSEPSPYRDQARTESGGIQSWGAQ